MLTSAVCADGPSDSRRHGGADPRTPLNATAAPADPGEHAGTLHPHAAWEPGRDPRFACSTLGRCLFWVGVSCFTGAALPPDGFAPPVSWAVVAGVLAIPFAARAWSDLRSRRAPPGDAPLERLWPGERRSFRSRLLGQRVAQPFTPVLCAAAALIAGWALRFTWWPAATVAAGMIVAAAKRIWLGGVEVRWPDFPLRAGTAATIRVATTAGSGRLESPWIWLGCHETRRSWLRGSETRNVASAVAMRRPVPLEAGDPRPGESVEFDVHIPEGAPASRLRGPVCVHWVLVVGGRLRGRQFTECMLLPVA